MTDHTRSARGAEDAMEAMDDLELITMAVNGHLSPERLAEVRHRLETDAAFRELAAPVLLTWSVPPQLEPEPRPIAELERDWDAFARKAGIGQYRVARREPQGPGDRTGRGGRGGRRGWWIAGTLLAVAGTAATLQLLAPDRDAAPDAAATQASAVAAGAETREALREASREAPAQVSRADAAAAAAAAREASLDSMSTLVPYRDGWMPLMDGIEVQLAPGATLRRAHQRMRGMRHVLLEGSARFRVPDVDTAVTSFRAPSLVVQTPVGLVTATLTEVTVTTRGDTTEVEVHEFERDPMRGPSGVTLAEVLELTRVGQLSFLQTSGRMRLVRGRDPEILATPR